MYDENIKTTVTNITKPLLGLENIKDSDLRTFLDYEIRSSRLASWISVRCIQGLLGKYFAWKTSRKVARYKMSKVWEQSIYEHLKN